MRGHPKCFVIAFDMAYFAFWLSPISAQHIGKSKPEVACDQQHLRKCPAHVVISNLFCATILHHFWEAASHFLRSVPVLSEDITANHRPKGPALLVTFCLSAVLQTTSCLNTQHAHGKSLHPTLPLGIIPISLHPHHPQLLVFSVKTVKNTNCFFRDPTSLFRAFISNSIVSPSCPFD